jgi:hypothetical protein
MQTDSKAKEWTEVRAVPQHLSLIEPAPIHNNDLKHLDDLKHPEHRTWLNAYARTLLYKEKPVAILGILPLWLGCAEIWSLISQEAIDHPIITARHKKKLLDQVCEAMLLHRVQVTLRQENEAQKHFMRKLGFEQEGTLRSLYLAGEDWEIWSLIREPVVH